MHKKTFLHIKKFLKTFKTFKNLKPFKIISKKRKYPIVGKSAVEGLEV